MKTICVFCGSNPGAHPAYREAAQEMGNLLAEKDIQTGDYNIHWLEKWLEDS